MPSASLHITSGTRVLSPSLSVPSKRTARAPASKMLGYAPRTEQSQVGKTGFPQGREQWEGGIPRTSRQMTS